MRTISKFLPGLAALAMLLVAEPAFAQRDLEGKGPQRPTVLAPPIGGTIICPGTMSIIIQLPDGTIIIVGGSATGGFQTTNNTQSNGVATTSQQATSISGTSSSDDDNPFGTFTWSLASGDGPTTTVSSNQGTADFPATANITFNASATVSSRPGKTFKGTTPVTLGSTNVTGFNPFPAGQTVNLGSPVSFVDSVTGEVEFTIIGLTLTFS